MENNDQKFNIVFGHEVEEEESECSYDFNTSIIVYIAADRYRTFKIPFGIAYVRQGKYFAKLTEKDKCFLLVDDRKISLNDKSKQKGWILRYSNEKSIITSYGNSELVVRFEMTDKKCTEPGYDLGIFNIDYRPMLVCISMSDSVIVNEVDENKIIETFNEGYSEIPKYFNIQENVSADILIWSGVNGKYMISFQLILIDGRYDPFANAYVKIVNGVLVSKSLRKVSTANWVVMEENYTPEYSSIKIRHSLKQNTVLNFICKPVPGICGFVITSRNS